MNKLFVAVRRQAVHKCNIVDKRRWLPWGAAVDRHALGPGESSGLRLFEHCGLEAMALQEFVELGTVSLGQGCGLGHVAAGDLQQPDKIVALELLAGLLE